MKRRLIRWALWGMAAIAFILVWRTFIDNPAGQWEDDVDAYVIPALPPLRESAQITFDLTTPTQDSIPEAVAVPVNRTLTPETSTAPNLAQPSVPTIQVITDPAIVTASANRRAPAVQPPANLTAATITHATIGALAVEHPDLLPLFLIDGAGLTNCVNQMLGLNNAGEAATSRSEPVDLFQCLRDTYAGRHQDIWFNLPQAVREERLRNLAQEYWAVSTYDPNAVDEQAMACYQQLLPLMPALAEVEEATDLAQRYLNARRELQLCILPPGAPVPTLVVVPAPAPQVSPQTASSRSLPADVNPLIAGATLVITAESHPEVLPKVLFDSSGLSNCEAQVPPPLVVDTTKAKQVLDQHQMDLTNCLTAAYSQAGPEEWFHVSLEERERPFQWIVAHSWDAVVTLRSVPVDEYNPCYQELWTRVPVAAASATAQELTGYYLALVQDASTCQISALNALPAP